MKEKSKVTKEKFIICQPSGGRCNICGNIYAYGEVACESGHVKGIEYNIVIK